MVNEGLRFIRPIANHIRPYVKFCSAACVLNCTSSYQLDPARLLARHDYTADVIGQWANAANLCLASEVVDGLRFYTRRRVFPRFGTQNVLPFPTLVWIVIDDLRVVSAKTGIPGVNLQHARA